MGALLAGETDETKAKAEDVWTATVQKTNMGRRLPTRDGHDDTVETFTIPVTATVAEVLQLFRSHGASSWMTDVGVLSNIGIYIKLEGPAPEEKVPFRFENGDDRPVPEEQLKASAKSLGFVPRKEAYQFGQLPPGAYD